MQIRSTMRYHLMPVRIAVIQKTRNNMHWWGYGEKGTLMLCWWESKLVWPLWKTVWRFLKKIRSRTSIWSSSPLWGIFLKKTKTLIEKCTPVSTAALFIIAKIPKQLKCPLMDECIKKMRCMHIQENIIQP